MTVKLLLALLMITKLILYVKKTMKNFIFKVAYHLDSEKTIEREFRPLTLINDNYPKYVSTMGKENHSRDGIEHINIIQFLREFFY